MNHFIPVLKLTRARIRLNGELLEEVVMSFPQVLFVLLGPFGFPPGKEGRSTFKIKSQRFSGNLTHNLEIASGSSKCNFLWGAKTIKGVAVHIIKKGTEMACLEPSYLLQKLGW